MSVDLAKNASSPAPVAGASGVWIAATTELQHGSFRKLVVHGTFQVTDDEAAAIGVKPLQRAVVLTITSGLEHHSLQMLGEALAFDDDELERGGRVSGWFNVDLCARFRSAPYQKLHVTASIGPFVSNTLLVGA